MEKIKSFFKKALETIVDVFKKIVTFLKTPLGKKIVKITLDVLLYAFVALCLIIVAITLFAPKESDGTREVFGTQIRIVTSDSMAKCEQTDVSDYRIKSIKVRSMIFIDVVPDDEVEAQKWYSKLKVGDVLTFKYVYVGATEQITITHRIINIEQKEDGHYIIDLAGDNKNADGGQLIQRIDTSGKEPYNYVIGKVTGKNYLLGFVMSLFKSKVGIVLIIMIPCLILITFEVIKIVTTLKEDKEDKKQSEQQDELEALRKRIAELEAKNKEDE